MRVLGIIRDYHGCSFYRIMQPLAKLQEHGLADVVLMEENEMGVESGFQRVLDADIIVFHRPASKQWLDFIRRAQDAGKIVVVDYDDDPFNTSPWNPFYKYIGVKEYDFKWEDGTIDKVWQNGVDGFDLERNILRRDMFRACFSKADLFSVSCPNLKEALKDTNKNIAVLPNLQDLSLYPDCTLVKDKWIRIGWQGGHSHYEDLSMIKDQVHRILKKHKNTKFVVLGDETHQCLFKDLPQERVEWHRFVTNDAYQLKLKCLNLDIGLCPITDTIFNRSKTAIKWMEYTLTGAATIASNIPPYSDAITDDRTGMLAGPDQWFDKMDWLIKNKAQRLKMIVVAKEIIEEKHNADKQAYLWADAYKSLLNKELKDELRV